MMTNPETPAGVVPSLVDLLEAEYKAYLGKQLEEAKKRGQPAPVANLDEAFHQAPTPYFLAWARKYFAEHRVTEVFYPSSDVAVRFSNNKSAVIGPPAKRELRGATVKTDVVHMTGLADDYRGNDEHQ